MNYDLITTLLHQSEGETLDFKRDQYKLAGADKATKSDLIKDILAFANAWKTTAAHILIGVQENGVGGKATVIGVGDHPDDAALQELVNSKTNRPVRFGYRAISFEGKSIGLLTIDEEQDRPLFLTKDYGSLRQGVVKIRRGSSTVDAGLDEIAQMGAARVTKEKSTPRIELEFGDTQRKRRLGHHVVATPVRFTDPPEPPSPKPKKLAAELHYRLNESEEKLRLALQTFQSGIQSFGSKEPTELDRFRWRQEIAQMFAVGFWAKNSGEETMSDVRVLINGPSDGELVFWDDTCHPQDESRYQLPARADVNYTQHGDHWSIEVAFGKLQPKSEHFSNDLLYVGSLQSKKLRWTAQVFSDDLPEPAEFELAFDIQPFDTPYDEAASQSLDSARCVSFAETVDDSETGV